MVGQWTRQSVDRSFNWSVGGLLLVVVVVVNQKISISIKVKVGALEGDVSFVANEEEVKAHTLGGARRPVD